jgi:hypothetical protein
MNGRECWRDRLGFRCDGVYQKLQYYSVLNIINLKLYNVYNVYNVL